MRTQPNRTVVLVEEDAALRTALTFTLELDGFAVETVQTGEELLSHGLPALPACLVIDQDLSGMTGVEALAALRARGVALPALLIAGHPKPAFRKAAVDLGAGVVEKPLLNDTLASEIEAHMRRAASGLFADS